MAGKLDSNKLVIGLRKDFKKPENQSEELAVETVIKKIHAAGEKEKVIVGKATKRITLDIDKPLHKQIAIRLMDKDVTFKDYFLDLAKKDLGIS